jgi:predicted DNA-binding protein with PD1-like motif
LFLSYGGGFEVVGFATITRGREQPHIHVHASVGRGGEALTGCLRKKATVYIVIEAVIIEIVGAAISIRKDPVTGLDLPEPGSSMHP